MNTLSSLIMPLILGLCGIFILFSKKNLFDSFIEGAESGIKTAVSLLPTLVLMCSAASMFTSSGGGKILADILSPVTDIFNIPGTILPFLAVRPISGSASNSVLSELFKNVGTDSTDGFVASIIAGSSDTMLYIFAVYFSAVGVKNTRYATATGFISMLAVIILASLIAPYF